MPTSRSRAPSRMWSNASVASRTETSSMLLNEEASTCSQTNAAKHPADIVIHFRRSMSGEQDGATCNVNQATDLRPICRTTCRTKDFLARVTQFPQSPSFVLLNSSLHLFDGLPLQHPLVLFGEQTRDAHAFPKLALRTATSLAVTLFHSFLELRRRHLIFAVLVSPLLVVGIHLTAGCLEVAVVDKLVFYEVTEH